MRTLLIPTDFKPACLHGLHRLLQQYYPDKINILLVHMMKITDSMQELLMLSRRSSEYRLISDDFYRGCAQLKQNYEQIANIRIEFFYGSTLAVFKNFLEANNVDNIVMLEGYTYDILTKNSIQPAVLVDRAGLPVVNIDCQPQHVPAVPSANNLLIEEPA